MTPSHLFLASLALASVTQVNAAIVQYTDRVAFLAALTSTPVSTDFSDLTAGPFESTTLTLFGANPGAALLLETRDATNRFAGNNLWISDLGNLSNAVGAATTYSDQLRLGSSGFLAIGADWFLGDFDDNHLAGSVVLTFSDGTTQTVTSATQADSFRGFISDSPLTSVRVAPSDPTTVAGWATIDNLTIAVPEPSAALFGGLAGIVPLLRRRRSA